MVVLRKPNFCVTKKTEERERESFMGNSFFPFVLSRNMQTQFLENRELPQSYFFSEA